MISIPVKFVCPECGCEWIEVQEPNDEWFKLATRQTLCEWCSKKTIQKIKEKWEHEILSCGSSCSERSYDKTTNGYY